MKKKIAFITGVTGQDGSYLAEFLLNKNYQVHGLKRRSSSINTNRIDHIYEEKFKKRSNFKLHHGDMTDTPSIYRLMSTIKPDEVYNLAAQSHVKVSFEIPYYTAQVDGLGTLAILEAVKNHCPKARVYQASTSELYGGMNYNMPETGYTEESIMHPRSPYGVAKLYGLWITKNYRESYGMYISNGILFNHEGERRGETFVTRKITIGLSKIKKSLIDKTDFETLKLGNLYSKRDWGYAKDYVEGMWLMLQQDKPDDYVLATNETHSIKEFVDLAIEQCGFDVDWIGEGIDEKLVTKSGRKVIVEIDSKYYRPAEVDTLLGDYSKAKNILGWEPNVTFENLVKIMMKSDLKKINII
jgi:GDPmannose 4,6-dehydratase